MKKNYTKVLLVVCLACALTVVPAVLHAQYYYFNDRYYERSFVFDIGGQVGLMNCLTDLGGANINKGYYINEVRLKNSRLTGGIHAGVMYKRLAGLRIERNWGNVQAADADINNPKTENVASRRDRNLTFRSKISEWMALAEFHPLSIWIDEDNPPLFSPYLLGGIGRFTFNPQGPYNGRWLDLRPLRTEGQGFAEYPDMQMYNTTETVFSMGLGVKYDLSARLMLRLEFLHRITPTDYLDDVSSRKYIDPALFLKYLNPVEATYAQTLYNPSLTGKIPARRGNPKDDDAYLSLTVKVGYVLGRRRIE